MKSKLMCLLLVLLLPASSFGFGFVSISRAYIEQLDFDTYRLRVEVEYGGLLPRPPNDGPYLIGFELESIDGAFNPTKNVEFGINDAGQWASDDSRVSLTGEFGYDFTASGFDGSPMVLDYRAVLSWPYQSFNESGEEFWHANTETHEGTLEVHAIPEVCTLALVGLGLLGVGVARRFQ